MVWGTIYGHPRNRDHEGTAVSSTHIRIASGIPRFTIRLTVFQLKIEVNKVSSSVKSKICQKVIDIHRGPRFWLLNGKILGGPIEISYEEVDCALPLVSSPHWWYVVSGSFAYCDGHSTKTTSRNKNLPINNATKRLHAERIHPHKDIQGLTKTYASPFPKKIQFHAWFGKNTPSGRSAMGRSINSLHADLKQRWRVKGWASITWPKAAAIIRLATAS